VKHRVALEVQVEAASEAERDRVLGALREAYAEGRAEASTAATWVDAYNAGFASGLTALRRLLSHACP
jgi:hypothetical protein